MKKIIAVMLLVSGMALAQSKPDVALQLAQKDLEIAQLKLQLLQVQAQLIQSLAPTSAATGSGCTEEGAGRDTERSKKINRGEL